MGTDIYNQLPSIIANNLKRTEWQCNKPTEIQNAHARINQAHVIIPRVLDLSKYAARNDAEVFRYDLRAIIAHYAVILRVKEGTKPPI